jgi:hypothetical protein
MARLSGGAPVAHKIMSASSFINSAIPPALGELSGKTWRRLKVLNGQATA